MRSVLLGALRMTKHAKIISARQRPSRTPEAAELDYVPNPRTGDSLPRSLRSAGIHLSLPVTGPARLCSPRD